MVCSYFLFLPGSILGDWYLFRILEFVDCTFLNLSISSKLFILLAYSCCYSVPKSCLTLLDPMDYTTPGFPVLLCLLELAQTHVHRVGDAIQPSHPLLPPSPPALSLSLHQGLFQWVGSLLQVAQVLVLQLQY